MQNATIGNVGGVVKNFVAFETVYIVRTESILTEMNEFQTGDVQSMLQRVKVCQSLSDVVSIVVTRYRQTGLELSRPAQVCSYLREIVPAYLQAGDCSLENGVQFTAWKTLQNWPINPSAIVTTTFETERERILTKLNTRKSIMTGEHYRNAIPEFTLDNVDDLFVERILTEMDKLEFEVENDGETKIVRYDPIRTNYYRKHADRFSRNGFDGENVQTIARSIFTTVWLESRQRFPDTWVAITHRERYRGKIRSARWIQARINKNMSFSNSQEWLGKENIERLTECENQTHFILLLSSYAMARAIQEIVQPFKMEPDDMKHLKASNAQAIVLENLENLTEFEQRVAQLLMTDHTERDCAEQLGVERTKIRQAKMKIKDKMSEFLD